MNYDFCFSNEEMAVQIDEIIDACDKLEAGEKATIFGFGRSRDLVLHIYKDEDFDRDKSESAWNIVTISTFRNGQVVDDTEDTHVSDALKGELERIWEYRDFCIN